MLFPSHDPRTTHTPGTSDTPSTPKFDKQDFHSFTKAMAELISILPEIMQGPDETEEQHKQRLLKNISERSAESLLEMIVYSTIGKYASPENMDIANRLKELAQQ